MPFAWAAGAAALGSIGSAVIGANAASSASKAQTSAANAATAQQQGMFNTIQGNLKPFMQFGQSALGPLSGLLGVGAPGAAGISGMMDILKNYPGYQFALEQGLRGVTGDLAPKGLVNSGQQVMGAEQYGQGMAGSLISQYFNQLMQAGQMGGNAAASVGQAGVPISQGIAGTQLGAGQSTASGIMGQANAIQGGIGNALNNAMQGYWMSQQPQTPQTPQPYGMGAAFGGMPSTTMGPDTSFMSDPAVKTDVAPANDNNLLRAVRNMPTYNYRYRDGAGDNGAEPRVGPMADDFAREVGGNGKVIPMPRMIGTLHGAVRSLADQVDELRRAHG